MRGTQECIAAVAFWIVEIKTKTGIIIPEPIIKFDLRGRKAGTANQSLNTIRFNPILLDENSEHFVRQTVGHEVAHLATRIKYGYQVASHGSEWKNIMVAIGLPPNRCHNYDTSYATGQRSRGIGVEI